MPRNAVSKGRKTRQAPVDPENDPSVYPPLPESVEGPAGPVKVVLCDVLAADNGQVLFGQFDGSVRQIRIATRIPERGAVTLRQRWFVLYHELVHLAFYDSGGDNIVKNKMQEFVCDAIATARLRERFG